MKMLGYAALALLAFLLGAAVLIGVLFYQADIPVGQLEPKYMSASSRYVTLDSGLKVHVRDEGNPSGGVLVLVHGLSASLHTWEMWVGLLREDYRLISMDLAAHGLTGATSDNDYTIARQSALVHELLRKMDVERYSLIGSSMGGEIAWRHALEFPARVDKVVLIGASGYPKLAVDPGLLWRLLRKEWIANLLAKMTPRSFVSSIVTRTYGNSPIVGDALIDRYWDLSRRQGNRQALMILLNAAGPAEEHLRLKTLQKPVLVMWGVNDPLVPVSDAYKFHEDLPDSMLTIYDDLAHIPFEEDADRTVADLRAFLER